MGDISTEPSMEEILSSIKRIIAEEGDGAVSAARAKRQSRPVSTVPAPPFDREEVLELNDAVFADEAEDEEQPMPVRDTASAPSGSGSPVSGTAVSGPSEPILSAQTAEATRGPLDILSRMIVKPEVEGSDTLEALVREMLRPMLREWLDANLPALVEKMVSREISRITGQR